MGQQQSQSTRSPQHHHSHSQSHSSRRQHPDHAQRSRPSLAHRASLTASGLTSASNSEAGSFDYTPSPSTSLSPSLTRVETQHYHSHRHGSSLESYFTSQSGASSDSAMGAASSSEKLPKPRPHNRDRTESGSPRTTPVSVPNRQKSLRQRGNTPQPETPEFRPSGPPRDDGASYAPPQPVFHHPPRLPLPIEHEDLTPGSPVVDAKEFPDDVPDIEGDDELTGGRLVPNKSLLSQTTADDEDESVGDLTELDTLGPEQKRRTVPVEVTWVEPGEKIYVTGTFANWSKKFRMHRDPKTGHAKTTLDLLPGMHHIRYIVDGEMRLREDNDQAVDYTNTLVNIIEVPAEPVFPQQAQDDGERTPGVDSDKQQDLSLHPPQVLPPADGVDAHDHAPRAPSPEPLSAEARKAAGPELMEISHAHYGNQIPNYLVDLDRDEKSARFQRASSRVADIPPPPTLPGFLSKSILNGSMPMKDDSSVLNMPNHTVLNHLATSSIRQGVLATSLTTRYKRKYVTLITYRPTTLDE